ncbi:TPA: hypothetical protein OO122_001212 [Legionella pneumophila]|nr:hypothetical protein [Legionella pneumophila]MDX1792155.1 hypothetical protein [Legionella pneumophila]HAT1974670.1 hypothetical protein [Legionella pneumophila]HAT2065092.1 hypothetical protein [Legionella pneumophila]HAT8591398.1 hypothetical protein [Legionella pneumophila]HAU0922563.1 hypothetical protein [Legionella pneumophila]
MIEVNIWLSTAFLFKKRIKHKFFGPLLASEDKGENVGHVNFTIEIDERTKNSFDFIEQHGPALGAKKTLRAVPTQATGPSITNIELSHLKPTMVKSDVVSHSFWPEERPSKSETIKGKGVKPKFKNHEDDMIAEDSLTAMDIAHRKSALEEIDKEKKKNLDLLVEISDLEVNMEQRLLFMDDLKKLHLEKEGLSKQQKQLTSSYQTQLKDLKGQLAKLELHLNKTNGQITATERTLGYLNKLEHPDPKTRAQSIELTEKLIKLKKERETTISSQHEISELMSKSELTYHEGMQKIEKNLQQVELAIKHREENLRQLDIKINGRDENDLKELQEEARHRKEYTSRKEQFVKSRDFTKGRHPDYSVTLPTAESGFTYYVDEVKILKAMQEERSQNYSFLFNNCASSAKRCLLAGIDEKLRAKLKEAGLDSKFFEIGKVETCKSLRDWARTLESKLTELNFPSPAPSRGA